MKSRSLTCIALFLSFFIAAQNIEHAQYLESFRQRLKDQKSVTQILFLGDSHIQAGFIPNKLRKYFQKKYGNAGRGLVFPYQVANSNAPEDFESATNQIWTAFRQTYAQDVFMAIGASGFVIGNDRSSIIEFNFKEAEDQFTKVYIFNAPATNGQAIEIASGYVPALKNFIVRNKKMITYTVKDEDTFFEIAAKLYTTTTRLKELNGNNVVNAKAGQNLKAEQNSFTYNSSFENQVTFRNAILNGGIQAFSFAQASQNFALRTANTKNIFYGFQFLNDSTKGVVLNTVGVNGATYLDFTKYPLQMDQLDLIPRHLAIISLGTNESISKISKEEFLDSGRKLIARLRKNDPQLPILLITPTDNNLAPQKVSEIVTWIAELSIDEKTAFLNMYTATGGAGYFTKALRIKDANSDGVHFLKSGYEKQAEIIIEALEKILK